MRMHKAVAAAMLGAATLWAGTASAQIPKGAHFTLNIIGVENPKKSDMRDTSRRTIFVDLTGTTKIYLVPGSDFVVCDGNGFDAAVDCSGVTKTRGGGAVFQLPCNTNLVDDVAGDLVPCDEPAASTAAYEIWARALGKPTGSATVKTCAWDPDLSAEVCSTESAVIVRPASKKPTWQDVTRELTSMVVDIDGNGSLDRVSLFASNLEDWFWQYANNGLRLAQLRFFVL